MSFSSLRNITIKTELTVELIDELNQLKLLDCSNIQCNVHHTKLQLAINNQSTDGFELRCHRCRSGNKHSIRINSWFSNHHFSITTGIQIINSLAAHSTIESISKDTQVDRHTIYDIYSDLTSRMAKFNENNRPFFTKDSIVEIDESHFKWKVDSDNVDCVDGCEEGEGDWLLGIVERGQNRCWIHPIESRSKESIIPIINELVEKGTTIMTDKLETYNLLDKEYKHYSINKKQEGFYKLGRTRSTDISTQSIESLWSKLRTFSRSKKHSNVNSVHRIVHEFIYDRFNISFFNLIKASK